MFFTCWLFISFFNFSFRTWYGLAHACLTHCIFTHHPSSFTFCSRQGGLNYALQPVKVFPASETLDVMSPLPPNFAQLTPPHPSALCFHVTSAGRFSLYFILTSPWFFLLALYGPDHNFTLSYTLGIIALLLFLPHSQHLTHNVNTTIFAESMHK